LKEKIKSHPLLIYFSLTVILGTFSFFGFSILIEDSSIEGNFPISVSISKGVTEI